MVTFSECVDTPPSPRLPAATVSFNTAENRRTGSRPVDGLISSALNISVSFTVVLGCHFRAVDKRVKVQLRGKITILF